MPIPTLGRKLSAEHLKLLEAISSSARASIVQMTTNANSGHPGGSLSCIDFLTLLYTYIVSQTGEPVIVSNGHVSPSVYAILAEMGYIAKEDVVTNFRKNGHPYEGHVTRHVPGIWYGTGPLGAGISAASGFALAQKMKNENGYVYGLLGDGEAQEGQVYEMMNFASKYELSNFIVFMDYNAVQLTDSLENIMPIDPKKLFTAGGWEVIEVDGHDYTAMWETLGKAQQAKKPTLLLGKTIMGKGIPFMEKEGEAHKATWHGKAAKQEDIAPVLKDLTLSQEQADMVQAFVQNDIKWKPDTPHFPALLSKTDINPGSPTLYEADKLTDCRSAYGNALLDMAKNNPSVVALTADLAGSVKTAGVKKELPDQHIEVGIAEQHMVSCAGGLSLSGFTPFCSTFGAFMTSRAKDQARVNDINMCNVKMVATHCGLSVGEDGPTHQAIDDMGSMLGLYNTMVLEPADPNQCDRMIRYAASHYGNFYVRMGRHKIPVLTKENGEPFFDTDYEYTYGRCDVLREGGALTVVATGATVSEALAAITSLQASVELVIASAPKQFDETLKSSIQKTKRVLSIEDHNTRSGFGSQIARWLMSEDLHPTSFTMLGPTEYQLSGTAKELYANAGIDAAGIANTIKHILT